VRDFTSDPVNSSTFGTLDIRRRVVNATGFPVTRLRFRIVDISTFAAPAGIADLRARTSTDLTVSGINDEGTCLGVAPCDVTVLGTTLEQPPNQSNGGGFNSSLSSDSVTLATPLAPGDSINVHFLLGVQQTGSFKFYVNIELLTDESGGELLRAASTPGLRKSTRGTMVKTGTASSTPALPKLTIQSSRASKVMKVSLGPIEGEGPTGKLGSLGRTVAGKVAKRVAKQAVTAPAKS